MDVWAKRRKIVTKKIDKKIFVLIKNDFDISSESFSAFVFNVITFYSIINQSQNTDEEFSMWLHLKYDAMFINSFDTVNSRP